jgi:undecaprenyl-diphosphatase
MNPTMIILFFLLGGLAFGRRAWLVYAVAMGFAGAAGGLIVHALKYLVGRSRPEVWLGPFHHVIPPASSFPSGHTMSAFAIASVLFFGSRLMPLRVVAMVIAAAVGASRVLGFRHWPSDVCASALIGTAFGWFFVTAVKLEREP